jgi:predicted ester cyclase
MGVEPTGRSCTVDEIVIFRVADGRIAEAWEVFDEAGMRRQLGVTPPG